MIFPPGPVLIALGVLVAWPSRARRARVAHGLLDGVFVGVIAVWLVATIGGEGTRLVVPFWGGDLVLVEVTRLRLVFAWAFALAFLLWSVYAWRLDDQLERGAGICYLGSALGVVFAGDLLTLFLFWEAMALASTVVVLRGRTDGARRAAYRYLLMHVFAGVLLLVGIALWRADGGSLAFGPLPLAGPGPWFVFAGFAVVAAAWPLSVWLPDAYPKASPTGTVLLGTFTTKTAVYVLIAAFAGEEALLAAGLLMIAYAIPYALRTRDYRRLLAYSLVGQVGFMLAAAGADRDLGTAAAAAHAFMHVLYKALLFMSAGVVLGSTGRAEGGRFGGLWRRMPWAFGLGAVGAAAISALPGTNGYVSKSLIMESFAHGGDLLHAGGRVLLLVASAAAPLYVGLRFPWLAFSGRDEGVRGRPATRAQRLGMGGTALLCVGLGLWPRPLLSLLPGRPVPDLLDPAHLALQVVLLAAGALAFLLVRRRRGRASPPGDLPDTDALYLPLLRGLVAFLVGPLDRFFARLSRFGNETVPRALGVFAESPVGWVQLALLRLRGGPRGVAETSSGTSDTALVLRIEADRRRGRPDAAWPIGRTVFYLTLLLAVYAALWLLA